jgi:putative transposase
MTQTDHAIGRSRGGLSTKIHALVDGKGMPLLLLVATGRAEMRGCSPT